MAFAPQFLDDIRSRVTLSDVVSRRVKLIRRGREHTGLCPFHNEKTPSFTVNDDKAFFHCFGCGAHGDVITFVMRTEGLTFPEAIEKLAGEAGLSMPVAGPEERQRAKAQETLHSVNEAACVWFELQLRGPGGRHAFEYLKGRGLSDETIARFRLGFAPDGRDALKAALTKQGISEALLLEAGLIGRPDDGRATYDRFRGRVIFPITDRGGRVIAFGGRILGDGQPKYLNSPDTPLFNKGRVLYGLAAAREAIHKAQEAIVVEGYMDVIALHQAGIRTAVAPLGTALTEQQIELLWRMVPEPILCFDGDAAGQRAAQRAAERALPLVKPGKSLQFALLPEGEDPDSLIRRRGAAAMHAVLRGARPLIELIWDITLKNRPLNTPERRADLWVTLGDVAAQIENKDVQFAYTRELKSKYFKLFREVREKNLKEKFDRQKLICDGYVEILGLRANQIVILALINHPNLLEDMQDIIIGTRLQVEQLDTSRRYILAFASQCYATAEELSSDRIRAYLETKEIKQVVEDLFAQQDSIYVHAKFIHKEMSHTGASLGLRDTLTSHFKRLELDKMVELAQSDLAGASSDRAFAVLQDLLELKHSLVDLEDSELEKYQEELKRFMEPRETARLEKDKAAVWKHRPGRPRAEKGHGH
jgi:DNA primase catalytic core